MRLIYENPEFNNFEHSIFSDEIEIMHWAEAIILLCYFAYVILQVALVEHVEESSRADHDKGREYDAIEYTLKNVWKVLQKSRKMQMGETWMKVTIALVKIWQHPFFLGLDLAPFDLAAGGSG